MIETHRWSTPSLAAGLLIVATAWACYQDLEYSVREDAAAHGTDLQQQNAPDSLGVLIERLRHIPGEFSADPRSDPELPLDVVRAFVHFGHTAVARLVDCMDFEDPVAATIAGEGEVLLGFMCYFALVRFVHYEPTDDLGFIDGEWPGYLSPDATIRELRVAKRTWETVIRTGSYGIP
jgi:hypothetical protein